MVGGGAGGGGINGNNVGAGGGAGAYYEGVINLNAFVDMTDGLDLTKLMVSIGEGGNVGSNGGDSSISYGSTSIVAMGGGRPGGTSNGAGVGGGGLGGVITSVDNLYATTVVSSVGAKGFNSTCVYIAGSQYGNAGAGGNGYFGNYGAGGAGSSAGNNGIAIISW